jgi:hypothetical protein
MGSTNVFVLVGLMIIGTMLFSESAEKWAVDKGSAYVKDSKMLSFGLAAVPFGPCAAFDYGFHEAISGGIATGVMIERYAYVPMITRAAFHPFNLKAWSDKIAVRDKLDVYGGLAGGFQFGRDAPQLFIVREFFGARYYIDPKFAFFAEDCAGLGFFNIGLTVKL